MPTPSPTHTLLMLLALWAVSPDLAHGQHVSVGGAYDNLDGYGAVLDARWQTSEADVYGFRLQGHDLQKRFVAGYAVDSGISVTGMAFADWALAQQAEAVYTLGLALGARGIFADEETLEGDQSVAALVSLRPGVEAPISDSLDLRLGLRLDMAMAVDPEVELDTLATPMEISARYWVSDQWALYTELLTGAAFGYGGDGIKYTTQINGGLTFTPSRRVRRLEEGPRTVGMFASLDWRAMALGDHLSHGPGFSAGVIVLDGLLKLGVAGFNRPGPINGETFSVKTSSGEAYKGSDTLNLRSDGGVVGLLVGLHLPVTESFALEVPLTLGQAAFGFYLTDEDRETPDGRRVSEWENELMDGRDASFALGVDAGLKAVYTPQTVPWMRPHVGIFYTAAPGYDAYAKGDYSGFSVAAGVEVGAY